MELARDFSTKESCLKSLTYNWDLLLQGALEPLDKRLLKNGLMQAWAQGCLSRDDYVLLHSLVDYHF